jgi:hypothetical protein
MRIDHARAVGHTAGPLPSRRVADAERGVSLLITVDVEGDPTSSVPTRTPSCRRGHPSITLHHEATPCVLSAVAPGPAAGHPLGPNERAGPAWVPAEHAPPAPVW